MNTGLLIGGERVDGAEGERIVVLNPATSEPITDVAAGTPNDASHAVEVAAEAQQVGRKQRRVSGQRSCGQLGNRWWTTLRS